MLLITRTAYGELVSTVGSTPPETGALLLARDGCGIVERVVFDKGSGKTALYEPDIAMLIKALKKAGHRWGMVGLAHSHPSGLRHPSRADWAWGERVLELNPGIERFFLPVVLVATPGREDASVTGWLLTRNGARCECPVLVTGQSCSR